MPNNSISITAKMANKVATFTFFLIIAVYLQILPIFVAAWNLDGDELNVRTHKLKRYIAGEMPILPGGQGARGGQQDGMMGNGMGSSGRKAGDQGYGEEDEDADADDHIGESPNSVEAAAKWADWEKKKKAIKKNGQRKEQTRQNAAGRSRRTAAKRHIMPLWEEMFEW